MSSLPRERDTSSTNALSLLSLSLCAVFHRNAGAITLPFVDRKTPEASEGEGSAASLATSHDRRFWRNFTDAGPERDIRDREEVMASWPRAHIILESIIQNQCGEAIFKK